MDIHVLASLKICCAAAAIVAGIIGMRNAKSTKTSMIHPAIPVAFAFLSTCAVLSLLEHVGRPLHTEKDVWAIALSVSAVVSCLYVPILLYWRVWRGASTPTLAK